MIQAKQLLLSKTGAMVLAVVDENNESISVNVAIPVYYGSDDVMLITLVVLPNEDISDDEELKKWMVDSLLPFIFDNYADPAVRVGLYFDFGVADVITEKSQLTEQGSYYIAVLKEFDADMVSLDIIGCCADGTSCISGDIAFSMCAQLEEHSVDDDSLPILEYGQSLPTKYFVFRM